MGRVRDREPDGQRLREPEVGGVQTPREDVPEARRMQGKDVEGNEGAALPNGIHWGSIWAGVLVAITTFLVLDLLAIGIGLLPVAGSGAANWVSAIIGLIAFFIGGYVASLTSRTSVVRSAGSGLLHGLLVWALGAVLVAAISVIGLGQPFGILGEVIGQLTYALNPNVDSSLVAESVGGPALVAFFVLLLSALTAALGGWLGEASLALRRPAAVGANGHTQKPARRGWFGKRSSR